MPDKLKIGFIGAGTVGQMHIDHWTKIAECQAHALAELRPQLRKSVVDKFSIPNSYESHIELINNKDVEAVVVVTRRYNTAAIVSDCLNAGKHVFSEKPMAMTADQAKKLAVSADNLNLKYVVGYQRRHDAGTQIAKEAFDRIMQNNQLGKITSVRCWNFTGQDRMPDVNYLMTNEQRPESIKWPQIPSWLPKQYQDLYDRFVNVCCHDINMLRYFLRLRPTVLYANLDHKTGWVLVFDCGQFLSTFTGGFNELNDGGKPGQWDEGMEIIFEKGRLLIQLSPPLMHHLCTRVELEKTNQGKEILSAGFNQKPAFSLQAEHFLNHVLHKNESISSAEDAATDLQIIEEIWKMYLSSKN